MSKTIVVERDVEVPMRDGVILRADIYRLANNDRMPVLLQRTPYGKGFSQNAFALMAAERGYVVVIQDTRGRWSSGGEGYPFIFEKVDGYDTVEWVACQNWSNGSVGMFGSSYCGYTQFAAASCQPKALKTIIPVVTFCNPEVITYQGGAFQLGVPIAWLLLAWTMLAIPTHPPSEQPSLFGQLIQMVDGMASGATFRHLPLSKLPLVGEAGITPLYYDLINRPLGDALWQSVACPHEHISIPVFHIGGWYDIFSSNTLADYSGIRDRGNNIQKVLIGPWSHNTYDNSVGEADFGLQSSGLWLLPEEIQLRWFDHWLRGVRTGIMDEPPIRLFVMGDNQWRDESEWPLARTQYIPFYLQSNGAANSVRGDGLLSQANPSTSLPDHYLYDPRNPVPTRGGALLGWRAALPEGVYDQEEIEERKDVLVYSTPLLEQDLEVTGSIHVHLWASSTAPDTDFTAKLVDVLPSGYARNIQDGIIRARYRQNGNPSLIEPGVVYEYTINLGVTSHVFKAGHRIRLEVSSSNFPRFDRNLNTGNTPGKDAELQPALQTIFHNSDHPSYILLPTIPR